MLCFREIGLLYGRKIDIDEIEREDYLEDVLEYKDGGIVLCPKDSDLYKARKTKSGQDKNASGPSYWALRDLEEQEERIRKQKMLKPKLNLSVE